MATGFDVGGFRYGEYGNLGPKTVANHPQEHLGWADIKAAQDKKASTFQIWQLYDRAVRERGEQQALGWRGDEEGSTDSRFALSIGGPVEGRIGTEIGARPTAPYGWTFEDRGGYGFEMADIHAINTLAEKKELLTFAQDHGLSIGGGVLEHIQGLDAEERDRRHQEFEQKLADEQAARDAERLAQEAAFQADLLAQQEAAAAQASRVGGSRTTGTGGAASIKGSRLSITEAGGRKGTRRFARPSTQWLQTMGIGNKTSTDSQVTI